MIDLRLDIAPLRSPIRLADGSLRVEAIVAYAGRDLAYPWGVEVATAEALQDPAYHDASRGLAATVHHPSAGTVSLGDGTRVGTVTGARYDEDLHAAIRELTITDAATIDRILGRELTEISEGYRVPPEHQRALPDGRVEQLRRAPNHYALTGPGMARMPGATLRLDEVAMTEEQIRAMIAEAIAPLMERLDAMTVTEEVEIDKDDESEEIDIDARADEIVSLRMRARDLGIAIPDGTKGAPATARVIAVALGADGARCDSLDYCRGVIDAAKPATRTADWRPETRTDTTHTFPF
jgi:hypothetical protein